MGFGAEPPDNHCPLRVWRGEAEGGEQRVVGPVCQSLSHLSEVGKEGKAGDD